VRKARTAGLNGSSATCRDRYENGVKKGGVWRGTFSGNVDLHGVVGRGRYARHVVTAVKTKAGAVFLLSEMVKDHFMVASSRVGCQLCCGRARQRNCDERELAPGVRKGVFSL
jgi:hypothetical protein